MNLLSRTSSTKSVTSDNVLRKNQQGGPATVRNTLTIDSKLTDAAQNAIKNHDVTTLKKLLADGFPKNHKIEYKDRDIFFYQAYPKKTKKIPFVYLAIRVKNLEMVKLLIDSKLAWSKDYFPLVKTAICEENLEILKFLVKKKGKHHLDELLEFSATLPKIPQKAVEYLLEKGANPQEILKRIDAGSLAPHSIFFDYGAGFNFTNLANCLQCKRSETNKLNLYGMHFNGKPITKEMLKNNNYSTKNIITSLDQLDNLPDNSRQKQRIFRTFRGLEPKDNSLLHDVIKKNDPSYVHQLLKEKKINLESILQVAVADDNLEMVLLLLKEGASFNRLDLKKEEQKKSI